MTRIYTTQRQRAATRGSALDRVRTVRKKKPYKILLEAVTQEKKKLRSIVSDLWTLVHSGHYPDLQYR